MKTKKYSRVIEIAHDTPDGNEFIEWLNNRGYDARIGNTTGNYIDGEWTSTDEDLNKLMNELWEGFGKS